VPASAILAHHPRSASHPVAAFSALLTGGNAAIYRQYTWDAENRLIRVEPGGTPQTNNLKVEFQYDYRGRRIEKKVWTYNAGWSLSEHLKFIWGGAGAGPDDGWLLLLELDGASTDAVLRRYTWGLDVAGLAGRMNSLAAAGGIGGLLAVQDAGASQDYVYFHDALGSVGQVLDLAAPTAGAAMVAKYEYDPYGNQTNVAGGYDQPFRFSGKYHDAETGLGYWGYRYYNPVLGRWINRDPLGELGGLNLYAYVNNNATNNVDYLGLSLICVVRCAYYCWGCGSAFACVGAAGAYCGDSERETECWNDCYEGHGDPTGCLVQCSIDWKPGQGRKWKDCFRGRSEKCRRLDKTCTSCVTCAVTCTIKWMFPTFIMPDEHPSLDTHESPAADGFGELSDATWSAVRASR